MQKPEMRVTVKRNGNRVAVSLNEHIISCEVDGVNLNESTDWASASSIRI